MLFLLIVVATATVPLCRWACDDPVCEAECIARCDPVACEIHCEGADAATCKRPRCRVDCRAVDESDPSSAAPECETKCDPVQCRPSNASCSILCEAPVCGWQCSKPRLCRAPRCELHCERPAAEFSAGFRAHFATALILVALVAA